MADPDIPVAMGLPVPLAPPASAVYGNNNNNTYTTSGSNPAVVPNESPHPDHPSSLSNSERFNVCTNPLPPISESVEKTLLEEGFTVGMMESLQRNKEIFPLRIWIVDNSGSMMTNDGHRMISTKNKRNPVKFVDCTRWAEMQETVQYHAQLAATLQQPTVFRLLNDPGRINGNQQFSIAERGPNFVDQDLAIASSTMMNTSPAGVTPLTDHIYEIRANVMSLEQTLRQDGTKVAIIIATDGLPTTPQGICDSTTKRQFKDALRSLEGLPVWIVIRLSTDDDDVVNYYNELDNQLELSLEVLDDFVAEAGEVYEHNKWLNYALPLHRIREMGFYHKLFDLLDERRLSKSELREFFRLLLGASVMDSVPDPQADWSGFCQQIQAALQRTPNAGNQWNPIHKRVEPIIDMKKLKREYGRGWFLFG